MTIATVAELRRMHVVSWTSVVIHHQLCGNVGRINHGEIHAIGDDPRYWDGKLRPGDCCFPIVPRPDAPPDAPGWKHT